MDQLLEIHTIPIQIEIVVTHPKLNISTEPASLNITREKDGLKMEHSYPVLHIDSSAARDSMNLKSSMGLARDFAEKGVQAAMEATANAAKEGDLLSDLTNPGSNPICEIARQAIQQTAELVPAAIPAVPAQISWDPAQLKLQYEKDRLILDWKSHHPEYEFTPGSIEFRIKQYPKTEIEYIGRPHYIPPSADPEYDEDEQAGFEATA